MGDTLIPPLSNNAIEVALNPPYQGDHSYTAMLHPTRQRNLSLTHDGVGIASAALDVYGGSSVMAYISNDNTVPIRIEERRYLGELTPLGPEDLVTRVNSIECAMEEMQRIREAQLETQAANTDANTIVVRQQLFTILS
jgi:hypothetical protein